MPLKVGCKVRHPASLAPKTKPANLVALPINELTCQPKAKDAGSTRFFESKPHLVKMRLNPKAQGTGAQAERSFIRSTPGAKSTEVTAHI